MALERFPYVCIGSHAFAMFAHIKKNYGCAGYVDDPLPNMVYNACACIIWLYSEFSYMHYKALLGVFLHFMALVCIPLVLCGVF